MALSQAAHAWRKQQRAQLLAARGGASAQDRAASTQVYAAWSSQISLVLGKKELDEADFAAAERLIVDMVLRTVLLPGSPYHEHAKS